MDTLLTNVMGSNLFVETVTHGLATLQSGQVIDGLTILLTPTLLVLAISYFLYTIGIVIYDVIDMSGQYDSAHGTVVGKRHTSGYFSQVYNSDTKVNQIIFHPTRWYITLSVRGYTDEIAVTEAIFSVLEPGDTTAVAVTTGRLSRQLRILSLAA